MRLQLALNVSDLNQAVDFYTKLFNTQPHKVRRGYANFSIASPPLKLVLFENADATERLNHLGVEVFEQAEVDHALQRFDDERILGSTEVGVICCHATQNKIWAQEPQGLKWEWYRITDDNPVQPTHQSGCCSGSQTAGEDQAVCCT